MKAMALELFATGTLLIATWALQLLGLGVMLG